MIFIAVLFPPLYFLIRGKVIMGLLGAVAFILSILLAMTMVFLPVSLILWVVFAVFAGIDYRTHHAQKLLDRQARMIGQQVASQMGVPPRP